MQPLVRHQLPPLLRDKQGLQRRNGQVTLSMQKSLLVQIQRTVIRAVLNSFKSKHQIAFRLQ
jgi:hypothetical protein